MVLLPRRMTITRKAAKAADLKRYFTGKPCLRGHVDERWTMSGLCVPCGNEHWLKRQAANRPEFTARQREWRHANREHSNAYMRQWARDHPEAKAAIMKRGNNRYRALFAQAPGSFTKDDLRRLLETQAYRCANPHCRRDLLDGFDTDHIIPLSRGGSHWPDNRQLLCRPCNSSKGTKTMAEWLAG